MATMSTDNPSQEKFQRWYKKNRQSRNEARRRRYEEDKAFRLAERERVRAYKEKKAPKGPRNTFRDLDGKDVIVVRIGKAAEIAGTTPDTLRHYESEGLVPIPTWDDEPQRLYTKAQCKLMKKMVDLRRKTRAASTHPTVQKLITEIFDHWNDA